MNRVHSACGSIPRQSDPSVIAELQALALAIPTDLPRSVASEPTRDGLTAIKDTTHDR